MGGFNKHKKIIARVLIAAFFLVCFPFSNSAFAAPDDNTGTTTTEAGTKDAGATTADAKTEQDLNVKPYTVKSDPNPVYKSFVGMSDWSDRKEIPAPKDTYVLTVATGAAAGDTVLYFSITYKDNGGLTRSQYIFPGVDAGSRSAALLNYYAQKNAGVKDITATFGKSALTALHYAEAAAKEATLGAWTVQDYAFQAEGEIKEVINISVYLAKGQWSVQGVCLYKMDAYKGYEEYGLVSGDHFLDFRGTMIADLVKRRSGPLTLSTNKNDAVIILGGDSSEYFAISSPGGASAEKKYAIADSLYSFRVDFTDSTGSGIDAFLNPTEEKLKGNTGIVEDLTMEFQYRDIHGWTRKVALPVILSSYIMAMSAEPDSMIYGFAQKGESIGFQGLFPEFTALAGTFTLKSGRAATTTTANHGITTSGPTQKMTNNLSVLSSSSVHINDLFMFAGGCMPFIRGGTDSNGEHLSGASMEYLFQNEEQGPLYYYSAPTGGQLIQGGAERGVNLSLQTYTGKGRFSRVRTLADTYLVTLFTTDKLNAGTSGDVTLRFSYMDQDGDAAHTQTYSAKTSAEAFLGPWPATSGNSYLSEYGLARGGSISFLIEAKNLQQFTSAEVKHNGSDYWEMKNLTISYLESMSARKVYKAAKSVTGTNYWVTRDMIAAEIFNLAKTSSTVLDENGNIVNGDGSTNENRKQLDDGQGHLIYDGDNKPVYVDDGTSKGGYQTTGGQLFLGDQEFTIEFGKGTAYEAKDLDYSTVRYNMTYDQTQVDWGFFKKRKTYNVTVKVANDADVDTGNGDAGSVNYFYFQLVFKNGRSGFVQANQQLAGDAFRSGKTEIFTISTNRDYGELRAVNIIPEDLASDATPFDKLNIDTITVSEQTTGGTNVSYVFDKIGWIDIDYRDDAERSSMRGLRPRSSMEIIKSFNYPYQQRSVKLLCEVSTLPWEGNFNQFQGSVWAKLDYVKASDNTLDSVQFDVVQYIAAYQNKAAITMEAASNPAAQQVASAGQGSISDPETMFRAGKTDRFIIPSISDLKSVKSITFTAQTKNNEDAYLNIGKVTIAQILEDGPVQLTDAGEIYRNFTTKKLAINKDNKVYSKYLMMGKGEEIGPILFTDNEIVWSTDSWATPVARIPDSAEDVVNIYVYPTVPEGNARNFYDTMEDSPDRGESGNRVTANLTYNIPYSQQMAASSVLNQGRDGKGHLLYYALNVKAANFVSASKLSIQCTSSQDYFNHAIVQHVREGVVISTYTFNFMDSTAIIKLSANTGEYNSYLDNTEESLFLSFGSQTTDMTLQSVNNDVAVAIKYRSSIDGGTQEYTSPFVYLTDQNINAVREGLLAEIKFKIPYVRVITGYQIAGYGNVKGNIAAAAGEVYSVTVSDQVDLMGNPTGEKKERRTYTAFANGSDITDRMTTYGATSYSMFGERSVTPIALTFTSSESASAGDGTKDAAVRMSLSYKDFRGDGRLLRVSDMRKYIQGDERSFRAGTPVTVKFFLSEMDRDLFVQNLELLPYDPDVTITLPGATEPVSAADYSVDALIRQMNDGTGIFADGTASEQLRQSLQTSRSATWAITSVGYDAGFGTKTLPPREINQTLLGMQNGGVVRLNNITLTSYYALNNSANIQVKNHSAQVLAKGGDIVTGTVVATATTAGFTARAYRMVGEAGEDVTADTIEIFDMTRSFHFKVPKNLTGGLLVYRIDISPVEAPDLVDAIYVSVENEAITISSAFSVNGASDVALTDHHGMVTVKPGDVVKVKVKVENSTAGISVGAYKMGDLADENVTASTVSYLTIGGFDFTVPAESGGSRYRLEISPTENFELKDTLYVVVESPEPVTEENTETETDTPKKDNTETPSSETSSADSTIPSTDSTDDTSSVIEGNNDSRIQNNPAAGSEGKTDGTTQQP
ncbi:MAG: hypothetical protein IKQ49_04045 [Eubacterium sp.]|nr:hypothetical protein [Eubacterium sp.]